MSKDGCKRRMCSHDGGRVDAARERGTDRNIAPQMKVNAFEEHLPEAFRSLAKTEIFAPMSVQGPVRGRTRSFAVQRCEVQLNVVTCWKVADVSEECMFAMICKSVVQIVAHGLSVGAPSNTGNLQ